MIDENHLRCPNCGEVSKLWSESKRSRTGNVIPLLPYQKVISIVDIVSDQLYAVPCKWPFEYEDAWLLDQAQMHAANLGTIADVDQYLSQTQADLHTVLERIGVPLGMRKLDWNLWTEDKLEKCPRHTTSDGKVLGWERLRSGFYGNILTPVFGETLHVEENFQDLIAVLGGLIFAQRTLRSR